ncbi:hypothetical protein RhiirA5_362321 [Rhizophagus irregularis]|uniref:Uncharacterized protein n=1 Tax=Rhizophagus irregularis TaxID=588596 RepID=A0A2N0PCB7_9GLOM|nr:hypothetical protein RhiirA5_362321 [Rhizophagus irregularis]
MSGQNKRKGRSSQGEAVQNITSSKNKNARKNIRPSSNNMKTPSSQTEVEELKRKILELEYKNNELTKQNNILQFQVDNYKSLESSELLNDDNDSQAEEVVSDDDTRPAKRSRKKPEDKEKSLIKTLLKTFPGLEIRGEAVFTSKTNNDICKQLIPELQKELKAHGCNLSPEQVKDILKSIHKSKRTNYLKLNPNSTSLDEEVDNEQAESDGTTQSAKRQTKSKVKKLGNLTKDDDVSKNKEGIKIEEEAKKFRYNDTFKSQANIDICRMLIPKLQEDVKPMYNPSYDQVENWLKSYFKSKKQSHNRLTNKMVID